ncbi:cytidyltransferase [Salipaludibacillus sp. CF4.18]|uniref:cytidyltransferase n=1 Tax=Salipaludibacillus sp. CF4.18 TaxID=3373081 RepID=UPI003EE69386
MEIVYLNDTSGTVFHDVEPHVMALGFFDGVHVGHQYLLRRAKRVAKQQNKTFTVMTFSPHPNEVTKGEIDRKYLTPLSVKAVKMANEGCEKLFVVHFDKSFADLSPEKFINQYILNLNVKHVVVGFDFTFGLKAKGDTDYLRKESLKKPFDVSIISKKTHQNAKISSTLIRNLVSNGDVHLVPSYLGDHHKIVGQIDNLSTSSVDTRSINTNNQYILPENGSYHIQLHDGHREFQGSFHCLEGEKNEITLDGWGKLSSHTFTIKFINKVSTASMVSL